MVSFFSSDEYRSLVSLKKIQKDKCDCKSAVYMDLLAGINTSNGIPHNHPPEHEEQFHSHAVDELVD